jgi:hypothetical protein
MSVFKVTLNNVGQGQLDLNPSTATPITGLVYADLGTQMNPSIQRTIYVAGPNRIYRKLFDGSTFTDCNYWKRFAYPTVTLDQAFITVLTDDGSVYSDFVEENTYPVVQTFTVSYGQSYANNTMTFTGFASFVQITNNGSGHVKVQLNGSASAIFDLANGETQVFNNGDLAITSVAFQNTVSGSAAVSVQVIAAVQVVCAS